MRDLNAAVTVLIVLGVSVILCRSTSIGNNPNAFNSKATQLETYSSRYALPNNDRLPFSFGYRFTDDYGTRQEREEKTNPNGSKTGSYSFVDAAGTYRRVDYIADIHGFRATVRTNEPGTVSGDPAHVSVHIDNNDRNVQVPQQPAIRNSPQLEYSNHVFSRSNLSSGRYPESSGRVDVSQQNRFNNFGGNTYEIPLSQPDYSKNLRQFFKGSPFPEIEPIQPVLIPDVDLDGPYPNAKELTSKFFGSQNSDLGYGNKLSNPGFNSNRLSGLNGPSYSTPTRFPRLRDFRIRGRRKGPQYKVHTPRGYENYPDLPLYRDK